jgi:hypothetical protein
MGDGVPRATDRGSDPGVAPPLRSRGAPFPGCADDLGLPAARRPYPLAPLLCRAFAEHRGDRRRARHHTDVRLDADAARTGPARRGGGTRGAAGSVGSRLAPRPRGHPLAPPEPAVCPPTFRDPIRRDVRRRGPQRPLAGFSSGRKRGCRSLPSSDTLSREGKRGLNPAAG